MIGVSLVDPGRQSSTHSIATVSRVLVPSVAISGTASQPAGVPAEVVIVSEAGWLAEAVGPSATLTPAGGCQLLSETVPPYLLTGLRLTR